MKKIIFLIPIFLLLSCGRDSPTAGFVVDKITTTYIDTMCKYIGYGKMSWLFSNRAMIFDTCGKFNIGDTIKFVK